MWGRLERPTRGPRAALSVPAIVDAAITVVERDGLPALSMSRIAGELGSAPMSLYRHIGSKNELLALMVDAGLGEPPQGPAPDLGWRNGLAQWASAVFRVYCARPWAIRIPISGPPITPNQIRWLEWALRCMGDTGLTEQEKLSVVLLLSGYVRSQALMSADFAEAVQAGVDPRAGAAGYGRTLAQLIDPAQFPAVQAAILSGSLDDEYDSAESPADEQFVGDELHFGLERILDGIEVLVTRRRASAER